MGFTALFVLPFFFFLFNIPFLGQVCRLYGRCPLPAVGFGVNLDSETLTTVIDNSQQSKVSTDNSQQSKVSIDNSQQSNVSPVSRRLVAV